MTSGGKGRQAPGSVFSAQHFSLLFEIGVAHNPSDEHRDRERHEHPHHDDSCDANPHVVQYGYLRGWKRSQNGLMSVTGGRESRRATPVYRSSVRALLSPT